MVSTKTVFTATAGGAAMVSRVPVQASTREIVSEALGRLSKRHLPVRLYSTAKKVAEEAGVCEATARRHLKHLSHCQGYASCIQQGGPVKYFKETAR